MKKPLIINSYLKQNCVIGIIGGNGGIGKIFKNIFEQEGFKVLVSSRSTAISIQDCAKQSDILMISVPIDVTEKIIKKVAPLVKKTGIICDTTSLKKMPTQWMIQHSSCDIIGCHPIFGPTIKSIKKQIVVLTPVRGDKWLTLFKEIFLKQKVNLKITTPAYHDQIMSIVQGLIHFSSMVISMVIEKSGFSPQELLEYSSPIYRLNIDLASRILNQDASLYGNIQIENEYFLNILESYKKSMVELSSIIEKKDKKSFDKLFNHLADFLGEEKAKAQVRTDNIINKINNIE